MLEIQVLSFDVRAAVGTELLAEKSRNYVNQIFIGFYSECFPVFFNGMVTPIQMFTVTFRVVFKLISKESYSRADGQAI